MDDFKEQIEAYRQTINSDRCPLTDQELYRAIRHATWLKRLPERAAIQHKRSIKWTWVAAVACVLAIIVPLTMKINADASTPAAPTLVFSCNTGCDCATVLARLENIIK